MDNSNAMFYCEYCRKQYKSEEESLKCYKEHNIVYMKISESDLNKLQMFLFSKDEKMLTPTLTSTIQLYARRAAERQMQR